MDEITKGVKESKLYQNMDIDQTELSSDKAFEAFVEQTETNAMNDIAILQEELANTTDKTTQNELFETLDDTVLDFSETNPFGDVGS